MSNKLREALSDACYAMFSFLKTQNGGYEEMAEALDKAKAVLSAPPRNCDIYLTKKEQDAAYKKYREYVIMSNSNPYIAEDEMMSKEKWLCAEAKGKAK